MSPRKVAVSALNLILFTCLLGLSVPIRTANAVPIPFQGGMLDAHFRVFDAVGNADGSRDFILTREYILGADFIPGVPLSFTNPAAPQPYAASFGIGDALALSVVANNQSRDRVEGWFFYALSAGLDTGCAGVGSSFFSTPGALIVLRGDCTFDQKWTNLENAGWDAGIVVDDGHGLLAGLGGIVSNHTVPFALVTEAVGGELRQGSALFEFGRRSGTLPPQIFLDVTWTPNAVSVPASGSFALLVLGLACLAVTGRRPTLKVRA